MSNTHWSLKWTILIQSLRWSILVESHRDFLLLNCLILSSIILMVIYEDPNNEHIQSQRLPPLSLVKRRHSYKWTRSAIDRQTDRQAEHVDFTKLHGWETLAKIKNNHCREGHPILCYNVNQRLGFRLKIMPTRGSNLITFIIIWGKTRCALSCILANEYNTCRRVNFLLKLGQVKG